MMMVNDDDGGYDDVGSSTVLLAYGIKPYSDSRRERQWRIGTKCFFS